MTSPIDLKTRTKCYQLTNARKRRNTSWPASSKVGTFPRSLLQTLQRKSSSKLVAFCLDGNRSLFSSIWQRSLRTKITSSILSSNKNQQITEGILMLLKPMCVERTSPWTGKKTVLIKCLVGCDFTNLDKFESDFEGTCQEFETKWQKAKSKTRDEELSARS
jgi:hypothetical protein